MTADWRGEARKRVVLVAAVARNGVIGLRGEIPWRIPEDLAHFRTTTMGHTLVMGRRTYESIGRPLPGRSTIVLTRSTTWAADGVLVASSMNQALAFGQEFPGDVMVVGGATVYAEAMPIADEQILTEVQESPLGDTFYPEFSRLDWVESRREGHPGFEWVWWRRAAR